MRNKPTEVFSKCSEKNHFGSVQYVTPNLRLTQKYAFIKKIHNFYPIITKLDQNKVLMSNLF